MTAEYLGPFGLLFRGPDGGQFGQPTRDFRDEFVALLQRARDAGVSVELIATRFLDDGPHVSSPTPSASNCASEISNLPGIGPIKGEESSLHHWRMRVGRIIDKHMVPRPHPKT